ncbi:MAG: hypothetical protein RJA07_294 [Bacteroidota bacterium]|jgi:hypothetical protein
MKKIVTLFIISILANYNISTLLAQVPTAPGSYQWVKGFGSANQTSGQDEMINAMKLDNEGNIIVCGRVMGYAHVQGLGGKKDSLISNRWQNANNFSGYISKYDCNGKLLWFKEINDSINGSEIFDFVIDSSNNVYAWGKCNAGAENIYFGDTLFAPFQFNSPFQGPVVMLAMNKNGGLRWNYIQPVISIFNGFTLIPENQNASGNPRPNMMAIYQDTISLIGYSGVTQHTITLGNITIKQGYSLFRFTTQGSLVDATWLDSTGYCNGFGIDNNGNYIAGFSFYEQQNPFLDSTFNRSTVSYFNYLSTIIKFNRHHVIRHIEFPDSTNASSANFSDLNNGFNLIVGAHTDSTIYGNYSGHSVSGLWGKLTGTVAVMHFNSISDFRWGISYDSSYSCNGFRSLCSDVNGDVYSRLPFNEYVKLGQLVETTPVGGYNDIVLKISSYLGQLKDKYPFLNLQNSNTYSTRTAYQNLITDKLGNIHLSGNVNNNQVIVGTDTAKYYGGNNDMFVMRYGNPCSNNAPMIAAGTPSGLLAACNGKTSIHLKWDLLKNGEDKYYIYRSLAANSGFVKIDSVAPTINSYTNANVVTKTNYWYAISSHNVVGEGYLSMVDSARLCDDTLGGFVGSVAAQYQLSVYPNPCNEKLLVRSNKLLVNTVEVTNVVGRIVFQQINKSLNQQLQIDVSKLSSGIYFIKATDINGNVWNGKFVKE